MNDLDTRAAPRAALRRAAPALVGYAAVRALGLLVLAVWSAERGKSAYTLLTARWDALWYGRVAEGGYGYEVRLPNGDVHADLAFFPLLPWLERGLAAVTPLSYADAGFVVTLLASGAAAWGIFAVADHVYGRRAGVCAVLLWAVLPVGIVQSMAYSESLFTALAAWSLYAVLTGRWVTAGSLALLAGLTRPVGVAVAAAVWTAGIASFARDRDAPPSRAPRPPPSFGQTRSVFTASGAQLSPHAPSPTVTAPHSGASPVPRALGMLLAPLGAVGYVLWVGLHTGKGPLGYLDVQAGWRNGFDGGWAFARFVGARLTSFPSALAGVALIVGVALLIWLYVTCVRGRQPLPLLVYAGIVTVLALCASSYFGSKPRLLLPAFPLLFPPALALARLRTRGAALVVGVFAVASAVYGAFWLNGSGPP
ncbi:hypothetical protein [Streptomyces sp. MAA16]|uniref:hypothetical protein n=1 Tax=Streptomyces sp. MAA16 TaxID=3035116 RepID=UPI002475272A|nr:hypothetical protein [Streptomyces sp. MAA16]MDH6702910.1 hypothetical protein [Streptomyces sp. MAA16]